MKARRRASRARGEELKTLISSSSPRARLALRAHLAFASVRLKHTINTPFLQAKIKSKCKVKKSESSTLPDVDACLGKDAATEKAEPIKWMLTLKEQLEKILPFDDQILADLEDPSKTRSRKRSREQRG